MHPQSDLAPDMPVIGADELAEGLMLVRASTLKVIRLQLAMERGDRRVAIEAIDDLVALDRGLEDYLASIPTFPGRRAFEDKLTSERSALNREKLTLGAEVLRNGNNQALFQGSLVPVPSDDLLITEALAADAEDEQVEWVANSYEATRPRWRWVAALLLAVALLAAGILVLGGFELLTRIEAIVAGAP